MFLSALLSSLRMGAKDDESSSNAPRRAFGSVRNAARRFEGGPPLYSFLEWVLMIELKNSSQVKRVMVVDDHLVVRRGIISIIQGDRDWVVCAEAGDGVEAIRMAREAKPDVAVVDISMPMLSGIDVAIELKKILPEIEILIVAMHEGEQFITDALNAGARGYILKNETEDEWMMALRALARHQPYFSSKISEVLLREYLDNDRSGGSVQLTPRERQIVKLVAEGYSNKRIGNLLDISIKTVETHRTSAMRKTGAGSAADLTVYAARNGLIDI